LRRRFTTTGDVVHVSAGSGVGSVMAMMQARETGRDGDGVTASMTPSVSPSELSAWIGAPVLIADVTTHTGDVLQVLLPQPIERADGCLVFLVPADAWWVGGETRVRIAHGGSTLDGSATFSAGVADVLQWWNADASRRFDQLDDAVVMTVRPTESTNTRRRLSAAHPTP
jgi:hypothetical protein